MAATLAVAGLAAAALCAEPALSASTNAAGACGSATQGVIDAAYSTATHAIYKGELASHEVTADLHHVTSATDLASAVAGSDATAALTATTRIVYTPVWHIVRLRVLSRSGQVLADVGGPDILAPVTGQITFHGKVVGSFVMSVQDDLGYEKLVTRFTAIPIELYRGGSPLMGLDFPASQAPATVPPSGTPITVNGVKSVSLSYRVLAFPSGTIQVLLAIPAASAALSQSSCTQVGADTYGAISVQLADLINLRKHAVPFVDLDHEFNPVELTFVRAGGVQLASSNNAAGPASIPDSGSLSYDGQNWIVYSFTAKHGVHVFMLFPDTSVPAGSSGQTGATGGT
jgi:hypothetical protein